MNDKIKTMIYEALELDNNSDTYKIELRRKIESIIRHSMELQKKNIISQLNNLKF